MALIIVGLNAFFVLAEFSLVRIRKSRLEELIDQGSSKAALVLEISEHMDTYLSACQIGVTVASLLLGWFCGPLLAQFVLHCLGTGMEAWYAPTVSLGAAFVCIVFLHVSWVDWSPGR